MTFLYEKSFEYHQSITKMDEMRRKGKILVVLLPNKSCLYRNLHGFYGSNTKGLVETMGVEPLQLVSRFLQRYSIEIIKHKFQFRGADFSVFLKKRD